MTTIEIPPAARAEFVSSGVAGQCSDPASNHRLQHRLHRRSNAGVVAGQCGCLQPRMPRKSLPGCRLQSSRRASSASPASPARQPSIQRKLYFSEINVGSNGPGQFFITVQGQIPKVFDAMNPPAIKTKVGNVEDWTISNQTARATCLPYPPDSLPGDGDRWGASAESIPG